MKSKHQLFFVVFLICILFFSCEQPNNEIPVQEYSTPTIKGTLSLPAGSTVNPADIYVKVIDSTGATAKVQKANSDKTFVVQGLNADMSYSILFSSVEPEFTNRAISRDPDKSNGVGGWIHDVKPAIKEGNDIGSVKLKPLGTIRGKALIDGKAEHYDTTVYIPGTSYIAMTSADGTFAIYNVPEGTYTLRYTHDGYMPVMKDGVNLVCPENAENPEVTVGDERLISNAGTVEGMARLGDADDSSVVSIRLESEDNSLVYTSTSSREGNYVINNVKPGTYRVIASSVGYISKTSQYFTVSPATITTATDQMVLFRNVGSVKGNVKLSDNQTDNSGIVISFVSPNNSFTAVTDKDGNFSKSLRPDVYTVTASYPGYTSQSLEVNVVENALSEINLPSLPLSSGAVAGCVILSGSEDYSGVVITLTNTSVATEPYTQVSAVDGSFRFTGLNKGGTYLLSYSKDGYVTDNTKSVDVTVGSVANAGSVTLKSTYSTVKGTVQLEGASTHENVTILLRNDNNQYTASTDQKGEYLMNRVTPGTYTLLASKDGYVTSTPLEVVVEPSSEKTIEGKTLSVAIRSVTGSVTLELLSDYSGALVTATNLADDTLVYSAITNSEGKFTLAGMTPGEYSVVISCNGYRTETLPTINIVSSSTTNLPVRNMLINRGTVSGTATLEGRSSSEGITVDLMRGSEVYESTTTDESGSYSFYVPQGNYSGVRYSRTDFASASVSRNIALFADNYVSIGDATLSATHNTISGTVDVMTTDNEGDVTISFDGEDSIPSFTTASDGAFSFEHIPVGSYVMRFRRTDCSDITVPVKVFAADVINLGTVTITPNSATIKGTVVLKEGLTSEGVTVSIDMGGKTLQTTTDSSGRYEIGGVSTADEYTVSYSKNGWKSETQNISPILKALEIREMPELTLVDTTAPVINYVILNNGGGTTADNSVTVYISAEDIGSGINNVQINETGIFDETTTYHNYAPEIIYNLSDGNGQKTVHICVYDKSGNFSTSSVSIMLTSQKTKVGGVLVGSQNLVWSKENSPYYVESNILLESGRTLTIESGVVVEFSGPYYFDIEGTLYANGTEDDPILFYGVGDGEGTWKGLNFLNNDLSYSGETLDPIYQSGSKMVYTNIQNNAEGITGYAWIENCSIVTTEEVPSQYRRIRPKGGRGLAIGNAVVGSKGILGDDNQEQSIYDFKGVLKGCNVVGDVQIWLSHEPTILIDSSFTGNFYTYSDHFKSQNTVLICRNCILEGYNKELLLELYLSQNDTIQFINSFFSSFETMGVSMGHFNYDSIFKFESCQIENIKKLHFEVEKSRAEHMKVLISHSTLKNIDEIDLCCDINVYLSNLIDVKKIKQNTLRQYVASHLFQDNYWGPDKTFVLNTYGIDYNYSFIDDYFDNITKTKIDYSGWLQHPIDSVGYRGSSYSRCNPVMVDSSNVVASVDSNYLINGTGSYVVEINQSIGREFAMYRVSRNVDDFAENSCEWKSIENEYANVGFVDTGANWNGYVQFKNSDEERSAIYPLHLCCILSGPAGGYVFYDCDADNDDGNADGLISTECGWRYLEAAPSDIIVDSKSRFKFGYYRPDGTNNNMVGTSQAIGSGRYNTERLVEYMDIDGKAYSSSSGTATAEYAARECLDYIYGGYDDWFLPSKDELCEMYKALKCPGGTNHEEDCPDRTHAATSTEETRNSFAISYYSYWSSSETSSSHAREQSFRNGYQGGNDRYSLNYVRAVRAF